MAGGPNGAIAPCMHCAAPADRATEGSESDWYDCRACKRKFGISWDGLPLPEQPLWPISSERTAAIRATGRFMMGGMRLVNELTDPPEEFRFAFKQDRWTIGRHPDCDVQILSRHLAKEHAVLTRGTRGYSLRDTATGAEIEVRDGEEVVLGPFRLRLLGAVPPSI